MPLTAAAAALAAALLAAGTEPGEPPDPGEGRAAPAEAAPRPDHPWSIAGGVALGKLYDLELRGGSVRLAWRHAVRGSSALALGVELEAQGTWQHTPERLDVSLLQAGALVWFGGRARVGLGMDVGLLDVVRVTHGKALETTELLPRAMMAVDLVRFRAADVTLEVHASWMLVDVELVTAQALLGVRL